MTKILDIMIDIETTGIKPKSSGIWQIGVVGSEGTELKATINPLALPCEPDTVEWQKRVNWANWEDAKTINTDYTEKWLLDWFLAKMLEMGVGDYGTTSAIRLWSKGSFDFSQLHQAFKKHGLIVPWKYYQLNDVRTLCNAFQMHIPKFPEVHDALEDAKHQMKHLQKILSLISTIEQAQPSKEI